MTCFVKLNFGRLEDLYLFTLNKVFTELNMILEFIKDFNMNIFSRNVCIDWLDYVNFRIILVLSFKAFHKAFKECCILFQLFSHLSVNFLTTGSIIWNWISFIRSIILLNSISFPLFNSCFNYCFNFFR